MRKFIFLVLVPLVALSAMGGAAGVQHKKSFRLKPVRPPVAHKGAGGGASAAGGRSSATKKKVLVTLDGQPYTLGDWERDLPAESRQAARTTQDRLRTLDQLFESRLLVLAAEKSHMDRDSLVAQRLENARKQILINAYLEKEIRPLTRVDSTEIAAWYRQHPDEFKVHASATVRHIQVPARKDAERVREQLLKGANFADLAKKVSTDESTKQDGGMLGSVTTDGFFRTLGRDPALADTVLKLKEGEISQPVQYKTAWHIFRVDSREPEHAQPLDAVRDQIRQRMEREKATNAYRATLEALRQKYHYAVNLPVVADSTLFLPKPDELFRQAQGAADPQQRIRMYRELISLYPDSPFCAQAQFMIGFVYSEELSDYDQAEREFKAMIQRYPQSELVKSAQWMLDNMRKGTPTFDLPDSLKSPAPKGPVPPPGGPGKK